MAKTYWIAWNSQDKGEGAVFDRQDDAESALDGCDPELGFSSISTLAEKKAVCNG